MTNPHQLDSPCIAICTTVYDEVCKGCGRTYLEVALWNAMSPSDNEAVWKRIEEEQTAWRFNHYMERAAWDGHPHTGES